MGNSQQAGFSLDPKTEEKMIGLFSKPVLNADAIARRVERMAQGHGDAFYTGLLYMLVHLEFAPKAARAQWKEVLRHHENLGGKLGRPLDLRVALLDYFLSWNRKLRNPKILELKIYQLTKKEAISDELTGLFNYRYFEDALEREIKRSHRYGESFSLLMLDLDDFKYYNDRNGHLAGNHVLRQLSQKIKENVRQIDVVARYGGEEFAVILPATSKQGALLTSERIRTAIEKHKFPFGQFQPKKKVSVSGGIATFPIDSKAPRELVERADTALYRAKSDGKNNIKAYLTETRDFTRVDARLVGRFSVLPHRTIHLSTRDLSKNGILFESDQSVAIGSFLNMRIHIPRQKTVRLEAHVVRVERLSGKRFDIGVTISKMTPADRRRFEAHVDALLSAA